MRRGRIRLVETPANRSNCFLSRYPIGIDCQCTELQHDEGNEGKPGGWGEVASFGAQDNATRRAHAPDRYLGTYTRCVVFFVLFSWSLIPPCPPFDVDATKVLFLGLVLDGRVAVGRLSLSGMAGSDLRFFFVCRGCLDESFKETRLWVSPLSWLCRMTHNSEATICLHHPVPW